MTECFKVPQKVESDLAAWAADNLKVIEGGKDTATTLCAASGTGPIG